MKKRILTLVAVATLAVGIPFSAQASLLGVQDHGSYFSDATTGLDWLDVPLTQDMTYDYVSTQLGTGGAFEGWRYATAAEFGALVNGATGVPTGISGPGQSFIDTSSVTIFNQFRALAELFGLTTDNPATNGKWVNGILADVNPDAFGNHYDGTIGAQDDPTYGLYSHAYTTNQQQPNFHASSLGSMLVRTAAIVPSYPDTGVPEPPLLALLGVGLAGLGLTRRKRKRANTD